MSTNSPESGRFDQVVSAVTWKRTISPLPRRAAVTSGVPSASRAQVFSASPGSGSASTCLETVDFVRRSESEEGAARLERGDMLRRLPGERAAERATAAPQRPSASGRRRRRQAAFRQSATARRRDRETARSRRASGPGATLMSASASTEGFSASSDRIGSVGRIMPFADVGERLQRALEVVARREQRLRHIGARAGSNGDAPPARALVDQPSRASRSFAGDDDAGDVVAQFDWQVERALRSRDSARGRTARGRPRDPARRERARIPCAGSSESARVNADSEGAG